MNLNLADMTFFRAKKLAKEMCGKTSEELAEMIGVGHEHVSRHFREPNYNISPALLPKLCRAMDNDLHIEWQCIQAGGYFSRVDKCRREDISIDMQIARLSKEFSDVLMENAAGTLDGVRSPEDIAKLDREICQLIRKAEEARLAIRVAKG